MTVVRAFPRLHMGLVDLGNATPQRYGGFGCVVDCFPIEIRVEKGPRGIAGLSKLDPSAQREFAKTIDRLSSLYHLNDAYICIETIPLQHTGLGTKTAILLSLLTALSAHHGLNLKDSELQCLSGRGGVSGVGIHGFFTGGWIFDAGHKVESWRPFAPSRFRAEVGIPSLVAHLECPKRWQFALLLPKGRHYAGRGELDFFRKNTPVKRSDVLETLALIYHGILPAVAHGDLATLKMALTRINSLGFKRRELLGQPDSVRRLVRALDSLPCAVGMSSMGPLIFVVMDGVRPEIVSQVERFGRKHGAKVLIVCPGRNGGRDVLP